MVITTRWLATVTVACFVLSTAMSAKAAYPEHPVRLIVSTGPGGSVDSVARIVGTKLAEKWGQPVLIENRPGADGTIAEDVVAHAAPDGYTLLVVAETHNVSQFRYKLNYNSVKDFTPISQLASAPSSILVNPAFTPFHTLKDLIDYAKANPGKLNFGHAGLGTNPYLATEQLAKQTGIVITPVEYKTNDAAMIGLLGGEIQMTWGSVSRALPQIETGKLVALGVDSASPVPQFPGVPTVAQAADLPGYQAGTWEGMLAPAGMPNQMASKIRDDVADIMNKPDVQKILTAQGFTIIASTPTEFSDFIVKDMAKWSALIKSADPGPSK